MKRNDIEGRIVTSLLRTTDDIDYWNTYLQLDNRDYLFIGCESLPVDQLKLGIDPPAELEPFELEDGKSCIGDTIDAVLVHRGEFVDRIYLLLSSRCYLWAVDDIGTQVCLASEEDFFSWHELSKDDLESYWEVLKSFE